MGNGKKHCAIELDEWWWDQTNKTGTKPGPTLIVAPLNTFDSWQDKIANQAPDATVYTIDRKDRGAFVQALKRRKYDIYLMHWAAVRLIPELQKVKFNVIIGDEVHHIASRKAQVKRAFKKLKAERKL